jgi:hypothetical protein
MWDEAQAKIAVEDGSIILWTSIRPCHNALYFRDKNMPPHASGNSKHVSGNWKHVSGDMKQVSFDSKHVSEDSKHVSGNSKLVSGESEHVSGDLKQVSRESKHVSGDLKHVCGKTSFGQESRFLFQRKRLPCPNEACSFSLVNVSFSAK